MSKLVKIAASKNWGKVPQHLTLSVSPKGKVHFVPPRMPYYSYRYHMALCSALVGGYEIDEDINLYLRPVTCKRCLAEIEKRGWTND